MRSARAAAVFVFVSATILVCTNEAPMGRRKLGFGGNMIAKFWGKENDLCAAEKIVDTADKYMKKASELCRKNDHQQEAKALEQGIVECSKIAGKEKYAVIAKMKLNLALTHTRHSIREKAMESMDECLDYSRGCLDDNGAEMDSLTHMFGHEYERLGEPVKALNMWKECILIRQQRFGPREIPLAQIYQDIAESLAVLGHLDEAIKNMEYCTTINSINRPFSGETRQAYGRLAVMWDQKDDVNKTMFCLGKYKDLTLARLQAPKQDWMKDFAYFLRLGQMHMSAGDDHARSGNEYEALYHYDKALDCFQRKICFLGLCSHGTVDHSSSVDWARTVHVPSCKKMGKTAILMQVRKGLEKFVRWMAPATSRMSMEIAIVGHLKEIADGHFRAGDFEAAIKAVHQCIAFQQMRRGGANAEPPSPEDSEETRSRDLQISEQMEHLTELLCANRQFDRAIQQSWKTLDWLEKLRLNESEYADRTRNWLGKAHLGLGDADMAAENFFSVFKSRLARFGPENVTIDSLQNLENALRQQQGKNMASVAQVVKGLREIEWPPGPDGGMKWRVSRMVRRYATGERGFIGSIGKGTERVITAPVRTLVWLGQAGRARALARMGLGVAVLWSAFGAKNLIEDSLEVIQLEGPKTKDPVD